MKIHIVIDLYPELADPEDESGVTNEAYEKLHECLSGFGEDIDIRRDDE